MIKLSPYEAAPRLFECLIDRNQTEKASNYLGEVPEVIIAGEDMLRAAGYRPGSNRPRGWVHPNRGTFKRLSHNREHTLQVRRCGTFWLVERLQYCDNRSFPIYDTYALVWAFGRRPIWTRTYQAAMRLAEHCDPIPRPPVAGCWVNIRAAG